MIIREFQKRDKKASKDIFSLYWTDPEFLNELSNYLQSYIDEGPTRDLGFFVAEENDEILGIAGFKKVAGYLTSFALTNKPAELYVIASKYKGKGIGTKLKLKLIEKIKDLGFSEILFFSPNSHQESWDFHDKFGFERIGEVTPPEDKIGQAWRKIL
jgi:L-amino acid N-acyltransferase YncA